MRCWYATRIDKRLYQGGHNDSFTLAGSTAGTSGSSVGVACTKRWSAERSPCWSGKNASVAGAAVISMLVATSMLLAVCAARYGWAGFARLARYHISHPWLLYIAAAFQAAIVAGVNAQLVCTIASAGCIGAFALLNRQSRSIAVACAGALLNFVVMAAAGGRMPVSASVVRQIGGADLATGTVLLGTKSVVGVPAWEPLQLLSDRLVFVGGTGQMAAWSIGDLVLLAGLLAVFWHGMKGPRDERVC